jgi:hypothetical protein
LGAELEWSKSRKTLKIKSVERKTIKIKLAVKK